MRTASDGGALRGVGGVLIPPLCFFRLTELPLFVKIFLM
jgi:hypothetical protein